MGTNSDRNKRGNSLKRVVEYLLQLCKELDYIKTYKKNYSLGKAGYSDKHQFKAPYRIEFSDGSEWIIFTTTSQRDRIKEQYWDAFNLKSLNNHITNAYLVYPDGLETKKKEEFIRKNEKIQNTGEYSTLDELVSQDSFFNRIETYALKLKTTSTAQQTDIKGKNFETRVAFVLSNPANLEKWLKNDALLEGLHYELFKSILDKFNLDKSKIKYITSTADKSIIGHLPSGADVKTDVLTTIHYIDGTSEDYTISCKRSSRDVVSVHQYSADTFADVLDKNNSELRRVLNEFQKKGNRRDMTDADAAILEKELHPHLEKLCEWALGGIGGEGDPKTQWAYFLLFYDNNTETFKVHTTKEYCDIILNSSPKAFNTPFNWTYQGSRGTNIQLKCSLE